MFTSHPGSYQRELPGREFGAMKPQKKRMSLRGKLKLASWTFFGTIGCLAISIAYNWYSFRHFLTMPYCAKG
ncbi:MAG: hypothetical protein WDZ83_02960 [Rhizobiaceae bacterium]